MTLEEYCDELLQRYTRGEDVTRELAWAVERLLVNREAVRHRVAEQTAR